MKWLNLSAASFIVAISTLTSAWAAERIWADDRERVIKCKDYYTENGEDKTVVGTPYSIKDYIDWALGEGASQLDTRQTKIIPKLADYGHYAQPYLARYNGWTIGKSYAEMTTYVTASYNYDTVKSSTQSSAFSRTENSADVESVEYRLVFGSQITLTVRIKPVSGTALDIQAEGAEVTQSGNYYLVNYANIFATQLTDVRTIKAGDCTITVSPMSYVYSVLNSETTQDDIKNLVCALYGFANACN